MLKISDNVVNEIIKKELKRQRQSLELIPSENFASLDVMRASGSILTNKYSEGYAKRRYYGGNEFIDEIETLAIERAKKLFNVPYVNVQPYSGSPANLAVYLATLNPGDKFMGLNLMDGGHLTHGWKISATAQFYESIPYHVKDSGEIDLDEVRELAIKHRPRLIWCGVTAYVKEFPFKEFSKIADEVDAYLVADIAHIAGLIAGEAHPSPVPYVHIITTTTHKTLRGPRSGMIMITEKGLKKDPELGKKIDRAVFPGLQGGPHNHTTAALAVALGEALKPEFKEYAKQIVKNAKALAESLIENNINLVGNGTENHTILIDLRNFGIGKGIFVQEALDLANITTNKNTIPKEPSSPFYPSGIRLGTPAITTRGMKEKEMDIIGKLISRVIFSVKDFELGNNKEERKKNIAKFREEVKNIKEITNVRKEVINLTEKFPLYPELDSYN